MDAPTEKLPRGTRVRCLKDSSGSFTKGTEYVVGGAYWDTEKPTYVCVERDDNGRSNGWYYIHFEIIEEPGPW